MFFNIMDATAAVAEASGNLSRWRHQPVGIKLLFSEGDYFMPGFDRDQAAIDNTVENRRLGSVMLTVGWVLLWVGGGYGILCFISLRDGSWFWPISVGIVCGAGLVLVIMGSIYRRAVGPTRLGQRDLARTLRQQKQDEEEERTVA